MFRITKKDILDVYKEEGKLKEYNYCIDYLKFMNLKTKKTVKDISHKFCVTYNVLLKWKRKNTTPYGIKCLNFLKERNLLPYYPNERTARIVGFLHGDGTLEKSLRVSRFISSDLYMLYKIKEDFEKEFMIIGKIKKKRDKGEIVFIYNKKSKATKPTYELLFHSKAIGSLLFKLGVPKGIKISQKIFVPKWIIKGNKNIQKAFLHGLFDSELSNARISTFKGHKNNLSNPRMEMGKIKCLEKNLRSYLNQVKFLLENFGVISKVTYPRKYEDGKISLTLSISNKLLNIYNFVDKIGFYYNVLRMQEASKTKELALEKIKKKNALYKILKYSKNRSSFTLQDLEHNLDMATSSTKIWGQYLYKNGLFDRKKQINKWFRYYPNLGKINQIIKKPLLLEDLPRLRVR